VLVSGRVILIVSEREKREFSPGNVSSSRKSKIEKGRKTAAAVRWWGGDTTPPLSNNITHARNRRKRLASCFSPPPFWRESECKEVRKEKEKEKEKRRENWATVQQLFPTSRVLLHLVVLLLCGRLFLFSF
jgi:hypothetical protein